MIGHCLQGRTENKYGSTLPDVAKRSRVGVWEYGSVKLTT